jgi:hypothetical protein
MTIYQLLFNRLTLFIIHFSVSSVFSVAKNCVYRCESVSNFSLCLGALVAEIQLVRHSLLVRHSFSDGGGEGGSIKTY